MKCWSVSFILKVRSSLLSPDCVCYSRNSSFIKTLEAFIENNILTCKVLSGADGSVDPHGCKVRGYKDICSETEQLARRNQTMTDTFLWQMLVLYLCVCSSAVLFEEESEFY